MELFFYFTLTALALIILGAFSFAQTLRAATNAEHIRHLETRCDDYATAIIQHPGMCGIPEVNFTDPTRRAHAIALRNEKIAQERKESARLHMVGELRAPGGNPATLHRAALSTPMKAPRPDMLMSSGIVMAPDTGPCEIDPHHGGSVTTPGRLS